MIYGRLNQTADISETKCEILTENINVVYIAYEDLPNFYGKTIELDSTFETLLANTKDKLDWKMHFDILENLRILNKYNNLALLNKISIFIPFLYQGIDNIRSNVSKNALLFLKELIQNSVEVPPPEDLIFKLLPLILDKAISDKAFIKNEARSCLKEFEKNGCWDSSVTIFCDKCFDKNSNVCELSMNTLLEIIKNAKEKICKNLNKNTFHIMFKAFLKNLEGKRALLKKLSEEAIKKLLEYTLNNNTDNIDDYLKIEINLTDTEITLIKTTLKDKKVKQPKAEFLKFIQEKKMKIEKEGNDSQPDKIILSNEEEKENEGVKINVKVNHKKIEGANKFQELQQQGR